MRITLVIKFNLMKILKLSIFGLFFSSIVLTAVPARAGVMRGDCSIFQSQTEGIPEFDDCDVTLTKGEFTVEMFRTDTVVEIPIAQIIDAHVNTYTVADFKARTAFALTYQSDHPDGFDILTFRVKTKRSATVMAALRQLLNIEVVGNL